MTDDEIVLSSLLEKSSDACFLREMIGFAALRLMQQETEAICNAAPGERGADRRNQRNSYRDRETRTGTVELRIPELRRSSYFPAFLEPRRVAEKGSAVSTCDLFVPLVRSADVIPLLSVAAHSDGLSSGRTTAAIQLSDGATGGLGGDRSGHPSGRVAMVNTQFPADDRLQHHCHIASFSRRLDMVWPDSLQSGQNRRASVFGRPDAFRAQQAGR